MLEQGRLTAERRRHPRTKMETTLRSICLDPAAVDIVSTLETVDISRGGVGAMSLRSFYPGQRVVLCLPLAGGLGNRNLYATVVRSRFDAQQQGYRVGMEFDGAAMGAALGLDVAMAAA